MSCRDWDPGEWAMVLFVACLPIGTLGFVIAFICSVFTGKGW